MRWTYNNELKCRITDENCLNCKDNCCKSCFETDGGGIFRSLSAAELELLVNDKREIKFRSGETILKQNTDTSHLICIRHGIAKVYVEGYGGKNLIIRMVKDSELIISGGFLTKVARPFTVSAVTETECCFINPDRIVHFLSANPDFTKSFLDEYHRQSNQIFNTLVNLTLKYMPGRVADTLLYLKDEVFGTNRFIVPFTRQEMAEMSAMTKESFVRILSELKNSGLIRIEEKIIEILDEEALVELSKNG